MKRKTKWIVIALVLILLIVAAVFFLNKRGSTDITVASSIPRIAVTSSAFDDMGTIPDQYTGRGADISPDLTLSELAEGAVSVAIIMDDLDVPFAGNYTHWVVWNIPATTQIPEGIPHGETVPSLDGAIQGMAYGQNRYKGPLPPFGTHRYQFHVFVLDSMVNLDGSADKAALRKAVEGHILQYGTLTGWYPRQAN